jgi:GNAT superfamily N-acetyltransferase
MVTVRRFVPDDAAACCEVVNEAVQTMDGLNEPARSSIVAKNIAPAMRDELGGCFALVAVGAAGVEAVGALAGAEIKRLYVRPGAQRRGTGARLVRELEAEARRRGLDRVELQASPSSVPFYVALDYRPLGEETTRNGDAEFRHVRMTKRLE